MAKRKSKAGAAPPPVNLFLFADPAGGSLVTGEMYCLNCNWSGERTYNPLMPELEMCPGCSRPLLRPARKL